MWWKKPSLLLFQKKRIFEKVNKTNKSQAFNKTVDTPKRNKTDTVKSIDTSRSTQRTDTVNTFDKSGSIPGNI